jgi:hypothetical protein
MIQDESLVKSPEISFLSFQDLFATCLEKMNGPKFLNLVNIEFYEFPLRGFSLSILIKDTQGTQLVDKRLVWLH